MRYVEVMLLELYPSDRSRTTTYAILEGLLGVRPWMLLLIDLWRMMESAALSLELLPQQEAPTCQTFVTPYIANHTIYFFHN